MFKLHPDAALALNAIASGISTARERPASAGSSSPTWGDRHVSASITDKDIIGAPRVFEHDMSGEKSGVFSYVGEQPISISGNDFLDLKKLVRRVLGISTLRGLLSLDYVENLVIDWCIELKQSKPFSDYLTERVRQDVSDHQIWVPISDLQIQADFVFGSVRIITIGRSFLDGAEQLAAGHRREYQEEIAAYFEKLRRDFQGNAAVAISVRGEKTFAANQAQIIAEATVSLLRFFHVAGLTSKIHSSVALFGSNYTPQTCSLTITGVNQFEQLKALKHKNSRPWSLSNSELADMVRRKLDFAGDLIEDDGNSEFASRVRSSLLTYSRGMTFADISDRLVYSFSALEGLFLKDGSEPILQNVAERVAFSVAKTADERMDIVKTFRTVYAARSQYIHHRQNKDLPDGALDSFFIAAWSALATALGNIRSYRTTSEFLQVIERMKFS